jgi:hypothetical protein
VNAVYWTFYAVYPTFEQVFREGLAGIIARDALFCSECPFASAVKGGVKRHIQHCKKGNAMEWHAVMDPDLIPGIRGD